jgi:transposase-like protein
MMKKTRRTYTSEFKLEAIRLSETSGKSDAQIERDLGISPSCLYRWKKEFAQDGEHAFPGRGRLTPDQEQLRQLEREVKLLRQERDILKRSRRCFASSPSSRTQTNEIPVH